jgi:transcription initiation factor TFIID subunit 3
MTALMKKSNRMGDESKYQGTMLGPSIDRGTVKVEGGPVESIFEWAERMQQQTHAQDDTPSLSGTEGSVLSDAITMDDDEGEMEGGDEEMEDVADVKESERWEF